MLASPQVKEVAATDATDEIHSKFWCYFCSEDVQQHLAFDGHLYLLYAGLFEHISRLLFDQKIFLYLMFCHF